MNNRIELFVVLFLLYFLVRPQLVIGVSDLKLPFLQFEKQNLTRGYYDEPTHGAGKLDELAIDFSKTGCESYGSPVLAVSDGRIVFVYNGPDDYGRGYGRNIKIELYDGAIARFAHLLRYAVGVQVGQVVKQGQILGYQGNTGNVSGIACKEHPGTHLHFVMLKDGKPHKPEPMSGYTNFTAGQWYTSDNVLYDPALAAEDSTRSVPAAHGTQYFSALRSAVSAVQSTAQTIAQAGQALLAKAAQAADVAVSRARDSASVAAHVLD